MASVLARCVRAYCAAPGPSSMQKESPGIVPGKELFYGKPTINFHSSKDILAQMFE